ncbi:MAG: LamG-like jellyroll fold domain-containing protein [Bacteroidota bacterium]
MKKVVIFLLGILPFLGFGQECENVGLHFDRNENHIMTRTPLLGNPDFTLEIRFKLDENTRVRNSIYEPIFSWGRLSFFVLENQSFHFRDFYFDDEYQPAFGDLAVELGKWYHLVYIKKEDEISMQLNESRDGYTTNSSDRPPMNLTGRYFALGRENPPLDDLVSFQGIVDDVRIWDYAKTDAKIDADKNCVLVGNEEGLALHYNFNEGIPDRDNTDIIIVPDLAGGDQNVQITSFDRIGEGSNFVCTEENGIGDCREMEGSCTDFNDKKITPSSSSTLENWQTIDGSVQYSNQESINGEEDIYLRAYDEPGSSWAYNTVDFAGNWLEFAEEGCFCYDLRVYNNGGAATPNSRSISIFNGNSPEDRNSSAAFQLASPLRVEDGWVKICPPLRLANGNGTLPSNEYGEWVMGEEDTAEDWDNLVQNVSGLTIRLDLTSSPTEIYGYDNICFDECPVPTDPCDQLILQADTIRCLEDNTIDLVFTVTNNGNTLFEVIDFYDDLNDEVLHSAPANLGEGESYMFTHNVDPEQDTLFCLKAFAFNFEEGLCCHLEECVELEPCMDCEMVSASSEPLGDKDEQCCHSLTLENNNGDFYSQAIATINTAGVVFSDVIPHAGVNLSGGNGSNSMTMDMSGSIPVGSNLFVDFCLDGVVYEEQMEQEVIVEWYGMPDEAGNVEVICTDTLRYTCADCAVVRNQEFQCTLPIKTLAFELVDLPDEPYANYIRVDVIEPANIGFGENCAPVYEEVLADETTFFELPIHTCEGGFAPIGTVKYRITIFNDTTGVCCVLDTLSFRIIPCPSPVNLGEDQNENSDDLLNRSINIHPNPSIGKTNVEVQLLEATSASLSILDINGKIVFEQNYQLDEGTNQLPLDLKKLSNGLYHCQIKTKDSTLMKPLVIVR